MRLVRAELRPGRVPDFGFGMRRRTGRVHGRAARRTDGRRGRRRHDSAAARRRSRISTVPRRAIRIPEYRIRAGVPGKARYDSGTGTEFVRRDNQQLRY